MLYKLQLRIDRFSIVAMKYTFTLGLFQFEEIKVDPIIVKETGQNTYNVKFSFHFGGEGDEYVEYGIISEDRLRVACGGSRYGFSDSLEWVDEEMAENIRKI